MKSFLSTLLIALCLWGCTDKDESAGTGNIYGVVTVKSTAEPMRATGVELYYNNALLLKTVTYDDGHYEFADLKAATYELRVVAEGYVDVKFSVIVEAGRTARADMQLERLNTHMTVRTLAATEIGGDRATLNGTYTYENYVNFHYEPSDVGFVYSTSPLPNNGETTITSPLTQSFSNAISNLKKGKYFFQAYAKNNVGIEYGEILSFEISGAPIVRTLAATNVKENTATLNAMIEYAGDPTYTEKGFVYSSSFQNPTIDDPTEVTIKKAVAGTNTEYSANIAGLTKDATYYVRAYVANADGTVYGESVSFKYVNISDYAVTLQDSGIMVQKNDISAGADWYTAVSLCSSSNLANLRDWRLPTIGELEALYDRRTSIGGFGEYSYWSSDSGDYYYYFNFKTGYISSAHRSNSCHVRCVCSLNE